MIGTLSLRRTAAAVISAAALALVFGASIGATRARAANAECSPSEGIWACNYTSGGSWPKTTKLWFEASGGNNERYWRVNYAYDAYGGSVMKCAGFKSFDGGELPQGCSNTGYGFISIPEWRRPGWVYVVHHADGPRNIWGYATHG